MPRSLLPLVLAALLLSAPLIVGGRMGWKLIWLVPEVSYPLLEGSTLHSKDLSGKVQLINFWSINCLPCIEELPVLKQLYRDFNRDQLEIIGVASPHDPPSHVKIFQQRHRLPYPVAIDIEGKIINTLPEVRVIPTSFIIAPDGRLVYRHIGMLDLESTKRIIRSIIPGEKNLTR